MIGMNLLEVGRGEQVLEGEHLYLESRGELDIASHPEVRALAWLEKNKKVLSISWRTGPPDDETHHELWLRL